MSAENANLQGIILGEAKHICKYMYDFLCNNRDQSLKSNQILKENTLAQNQ